MKHLSKLTRAASLLLALTICLSSSAWSQDCESLAYAHTPFPADGSTGLGEGNLLLTWQTDLEPVVLLEADFNDKSSNLPIGTRGPVYGEPISVDPSVTAIVREMPMATKSLEFHDIDDYSAGGARFEFLDDQTITTGNVTIEADLWFEGPFDSYYMFVREQGTSMDMFANIYFTAGGGASCGGFYWDYDTARTIHVEMIHDMDDGTFDLWFDNELVASDVPHEPTDRGLGAVLIGCLNDGDLAGDLHVDNILVTWEGDCAPLYDVYLGKNEGGDDLAYDLIASDMFLPRLLYQGTECGYQYYWYVVAKTAAGETTSPVWEFETAACGPAAPDFWIRNCQSDDGDVSNGSECDATFFYVPGAPDARLSNMDQPWGDLPAPGMWNKLTLGVINRVPEAIDEARVFGYIQPFGTYNYWPPEPTSNTHRIINDEIGYVNETGNLVWSPRTDNWARPLAPSNESYTPHQWLWKLPPTSMMNHCKIGFVVHPTSEGTDGNPCGEDWQTSPYAPYDNNVAEMSFNTLIYRSNVTLDTGSVTMSAQMTIFNPFPVDTLFVIYRDSSVMASSWDRDPCPSQVLIPADSSVVLTFNERPPVNAIQWDSSIVRTAVKVLGGSDYEVNELIFQVDNNQPSQITDLLFISTDSDSVPEWVEPYLTGDLMPVPLEWPIPTTDIQDYKERIRYFRICRDTVPDTPIPTPYDSVAVDLDLETPGFQYVDYFVPDTAGTYYYTVVAVDGAGNESVPSNVCSVFLPGICPDLTVESLSFTGPQSANQGEGIGYRIDVVAANIGTLISPPSAIGFYISEDDNITTEDRLLLGGVEWIPALSPGGSSAPNSMSGGMRIPDDWPNGPAFLGALVDRFGAVTECDESNNYAAIPIQVGGCCILRGDVNHDGSGPDIADLIAFVSCMFQGGECPECEETMDLNADNSLDIADLIAMVDSMFGGCEHCIVPCGGSAPKLSLSETTCSVETEYVDGVTIVWVAASDDLRGIQFDLTGDIGSTPRLSNYDGLEVRSGIDGDVRRVGILDLQGMESISSGHHELMTIDGRVEVTDALACDRHHGVIYPAIRTAAMLGALPDKHALHQNYPNPFNPSTEIRFTLPRASHVTLNVFNLLGQVVTTLVDERLEGGEHSATWDGSNTSSGVYFYRIATDDFTDSRKMVLMK